LIKSKKGNEIIINILSAFTIIEYSFFATVLYLIIEKKTFRLIIAISGACFLIMSLVIFLAGREKNFDSVSTAIEGILIIIYCMFYLFEQLNKPQVMFIYQDQNFWIIAGFILYLSATLFLFILANSVPQDTRDKIWKINHFATILKNIFFAIAFSIKRNENTISDYEQPFDGLFENKSTHS